MTTDQKPQTATTPTSGAAIQRYKIGYRSYEWGQRSSTPSGIPDASGSWVRYADHVTALAAGKATAAQAVVQDDLITIRKPTTRAEMLWLLKLAHLVISDVDKTLEETFAPAQPASEASRFGSPELQAMIIARCVEKDRADSVQEDAALWHWIAEYLVGTRTDLDDEIVASETVNDLRNLVKAAIKQGATQ